MILYVRICPHKNKNPLIFDINSKKISRNARHAIPEKKTIKGTITYKAEKRVFIDCTSKSIKLIYYSRAHRIEKNKKLKSFYHINC